jgi:hypothetical protein
MKKLMYFALFATLCMPALADHGGNNQGGNSQGGGYRGVPGPIVGAGLPILAAGYGVYWLIRRHRRSSK